MGRLNGEQIGRNADVRLEDGARPPSEIGGTCTRCGRSFVPREDADGLCRDCSRAVGRKGASSPGPTPRPESPSALSAPLSERAPTCRMHDCSRVPGPSGVCRTHATQIDPEHPWNKYVAQKTQEPQPREAVVVEVVAEKKEPVVKREQVTCALDSCGVSFTPGRRTQRFHSPACARSFYDAKKPRKGTSTASTATSSPRTSSSPAPKKPAAAKKLTVRIDALRDVREVLPPEVAMLLAIAELEVDARARVVTFAWER